MSEDRTSVAEVRESAAPSAMLNAFRRRDDAAVRGLYREYGRLVYVVAHRALGRRDLAEEATQQTFVNALSTAGDVNVDGDPTTWMVSTAQNVALEISHREQRPSATALGAGSAPNSAVAIVPPDPNTLAAGWLVRRAIDALSPDEAAIVRLQHLERMTQTEISEKLEIPLGTVMSRSLRAHRHLATLLGHLGARAHE